MSLSKTVRHFLRDLIYPGLDLHTRNRASLSRFWLSGDRDVLDAGSGNGYFSWLAYRSGARVVALNMEQAQVDKARQFLVDHKKANPERLRFEQANLYNLPKETRVFDEIICFETLEHIRHDDRVLRQFFRVLKPGGVLHLCCPNRLHPRHQNGVLDENESGGHVRAGYTDEDYRILLEPIGFHLDDVIGIGPKSIYLADEMLRKIRNRFGDFFALPLFPLMLPLVWFARPNPPIPFSLYVRAKKATK